MNRYHKIRSGHSKDTYIVGGVIVVLIIVGLFAVWISSVINLQSKLGDNYIATSTSVTNDGLVSVSPVVSTTTIIIPTPVSGDSKEAILAKCLSQNKITMYGAEWCAHCKDQKEVFLEAWKYVPYVECPDNIQLCLSKKIEGYPTWQKLDGTKKEGFMELNKLAEWAGCQY